MTDAELIAKLQVCDSHLDNYGFPNIAFHIRLAIDRVRLTMTLVDAWHKAWPTLSQVDMDDLEIGMDEARAFRTANAIKLIRDAIPPPPKE